MDLVVFKQLYDEIFIERFWSKVVKTDECWNWQGAIQSKGYGSVSVAGKSQSAHRVSYEMRYGKIPPGLFVLHRCDNRKCVNPGHFFLGTALDNYTDMVNKGRMAEIFHFRKLTIDKVKIIRETYKSSHISYKELGQKYSVTPRSIGAIINQESWNTVQ